MVVRDPADPGLDPLGERERDRVGDHPQRRVRPASRAADRPDRAGDGRARRAGGAAADARRQPSAPGSARGRRDRTIAADGSLEEESRTVGGAVTLPRHPIDLDFNTATVAETIDQYNWTHTARADGGNGECEADGACQKPAAPGTGFADHVVPVEADKVFDHMLGNDPRPHYVHQPQLTEDRTLYPLLDRVIGDYRSWFADSRPLLVPTMTQSAQELDRQQRWAEAVADGRVRAWLENGQVTVAVDSVDLAGTALDVPLTLGRPQRSAPRTASAARPGCRSPASSDSRRRSA